MLFLHIFSHWLNPNAVNVQSAWDDRNMDRKLLGRKYITILYIIIKTPPILQKIIKEDYAGTAVQLLHLYYPGHYFSICLY